MPNKGADAVLEIEARLLSISHDARLIERHRKLIAASAQVKGRQSSLQGECSACGDATTGLGEDRLRAGLDNKCYLSMTSWKLRNPDTQSDPGAHYRKLIAWRRRWRMCGPGRGGADEKRYRANH